MEFVRRAKTHESGVPFPGGAFPPTSNSRGSIDTDFDRNVNSSLNSSYCSTHEEYAPRDTRSGGLDVLQLLTGRPRGVRRRLGRRRLRLGLGGRLGLDLGLGLGLGSRLSLDLGLAP